jgi:hypothetical protein
MGLKSKDRGPYGGNKSDKELSFFFFDSIFSFIFLTRVAQKSENYSLPNSKNSKTFTYIQIITYIG